MSGVAFVIGMLLLAIAIDSGLSRVARSRKELAEAFHRIANRLADRQ